MPIPGRATILHAGAARRLSTILGRGQQGWHCVGGLPSVDHFSEIQGDDEDERSPGPYSHQIRSFHSTRESNIAPFLPEIVIATGIIGGWVVYRVGKGKPLTPDDAMEVQEAYRKQQEDLERRQEQWRSSKRDDQHTYNAEKS